MGIPSSAEIIDLAEELFAAYGYWFILFGAAIEGLLFVTIYFPGSTVIGLGAVFARTGELSLPLVILVGPDTEGSPEIFAAALQESGRAAVVGLPTSGNIFGYETVPLPDGSRLTLAISSYKTESGRDLGENGVEPDVIIESDWDEVSEADDPPLRKAIEIILRQ